jgi:hypothetical protein
MKNGRMAKKEGGATVAPIQSNIVATYHFVRDVKGKTTMNE